MKRLISTAVMILLFQAASAGIQMQNTGRIKGVVMDKNEAVILQAKITIKKKQNKWELKPNMDGQFELELPVGFYNVSVEAQNFRSFAQSRIQVKPGSDTQLKIKLEVIPDKPMKCPPGQICL